MRAPSAGGGLPADGAIYHRAAARVVRASYLPPQPRNVCREQCKELAWSISSRKVERIEGGLHRSIVGPSSSPTQSRQLRRLQRLAFLQLESAEISSPHAEQCRPSLSDHLRHACLTERAPGDYRRIAKSSTSTTPDPAGSFSRDTAEAIGRSPNSRVERHKQNSRFIRYLPSTPRLVRRLPRR